MMDLKTILQSWEVDLFIQERHFKCIFLNAKNSQNQNDRTVGVGRDLCGLPLLPISPPHLTGGEGCLALLPGAGLNHHKLAQSLGAFSYTIAFRKIKYRQ